VGAFSGVRWNSMRIGMLAIHGVHESIAPIKQSG
jgi:hypothetical protein